MKMTDWMRKRTETGCEARATDDMIDIKGLFQIKRSRLMKLLLIIAFAALLLIAFSESLSGSKSASQEEKSTTSEDLREYENALEVRLKAILSDIEGIGNCEVMVTLESSTESIYSSDDESDTQTDDDKQIFSRKRKYVIIDDDGEKTVLEKQLEPRVRGVIVVCEGAQNVNVSQAITDCLRAVLGVSSANISVVKGGNHG